MRLLIFLCLVVFISVTNGQAQTISVFTSPSSVESKWEIFLKKSKSKPTIWEFGYTILQDNKLPSSFSNPRAAFVGKGQNIGLGVNTKIPSLSMGIITTYTIKSNRLTPKIRAGIQTTWFNANYSSFDWKEEGSGHFASLGVGLGPSLTMMATPKIGLILSYSITPSLGALFLDGFSDKIRFKDDITAGLGFALLRHRLSARFLLGGISIGASYDVGDDFQFKNLYEVETQEIFTGSIPLRSINFTIGFVL